MTVGSCDTGTAGAIVELSLFLEGLGHGQPHLQDLRPRRRLRRLLQFVAAGIMAKALTPFWCPTQETSAAGDGQAYTASAPAEEGHRLLGLRLRLLGAVAQGAELLLGQMPGSPSPLQGYGKANRRFSP